MATCSTSNILFALLVLVILCFWVGVPLIVVFTGQDSQNPTFTVESTVVKAYNLTSDNHLFCIISLSIQVHNPFPKEYSLDFSGIDMEVRKGKHHKLADDALLGFSVGPGQDTVVDVEAVGLRVGLKRKIAEEVRADVVAQEGRVNVYMSGYVGTDYLGVTCKNVVIDFSRSTVRVNQKVDCGVSVTSRSSDSSAS